MKKVIIAGLLTAGLIGTSAAQTVSVYGVIDTGFQKHNSGSETISRALNNGLNASRLGFKGSEDLGGGLKTSFMLEGSVQPSTGSMGSTTVATNEIFNREAWVGFSGNFGEFRIGKQDVTSAQSTDFIVSQMSELGVYAVNGTAIELGIDQKNVVKYLSPNLNGLSVQLGHASGNSAGATTEANADQNGIFVRYDFGKFSAVAGYQKNDGATKAAERDYQTFGVMYDFGMFSTSLAHASGDVSTTGDVTSKVTQATVRVPLTPTVSAHASYAITENGTQSNANKGKGYSIALTKALSKRTTLYTAYSSVTNEANSTMYMAAGTAPSAGNDPKVITAGISHSF